jgi:hypothetical protein
MYCSLNRRSEEFAELTPRNSALAQLLLRNWNVLPSLPPVRLADFILTMQTLGTVFHEALADMSDLDEPARRKRGFVLTDQAIRLKDELPTSTSIEASSDKLTIHALTLHGWMHEKQNLGVTPIVICHDGQLILGERQTICAPVVRELPQIWY